MPDARHRRSSPTARGNTSWWRNTYKGALYFDPKSVKVFDPIGSDVVKRDLA
jgi:hypothetical protein